METSEVLLLGTEGLGVSNMKRLVWANHPMKSTGLFHVKMMTKGHDLTELL